MRRVFALSLLIGLASSALAEEPAKTGGSNEGLEILKKTEAALREVKTVSYRADYKATGWATKSVPAVTGTAIMGKQSKNKIDPFSCEVKVAPYGSKEVLEFSAGSDGDNYFLIDQKTKLCHQDMDPAVLGVQGNNIQRVLLREFSMPEPFGDILKSGKVELKGTTTVGDEECYELRMKPEGRPERIVAVSKKDFLPRRATNINKNEQGEAITELTLSNLVVNPTFMRSPFELHCPDGFKQTDDFAP